MGKDEKNAVRGGFGDITRRSFLKTSGAGFATAVVLGAGVVPGGTAQAASSGYRAAGPLTALDPHAATARSVGRPLRGLFAQVASGSPQIRVLPVNKAKFLAGTLFDLRVEATGVDPATTRITVDVRGPSGPAHILRGDPERTSSADDSLEVTYHGLTYPRSGGFTVKVEVESSTGTTHAEVSHEVVVAKPPSRPAKNVIFFLGDGMGQPAITAARILSKGITEGKYHGLLAMDQMDYRGLVGTSGVDSIATDSANSMSAYMTGHKSSVNALGVYAANDPDPSRHPRVETMAELLKRAKGMAVGVVTTSEIQDATPAAVWAHTRRRSEYVDIMDQALNDGQQPDVLLGGGMASLLPQSEDGSRRSDDRDLRKEFVDKGYTYVSNRTELAQAVSGRPPSQLIGTFHTGNLNVYLDREHSPDPAVLGDFPDQPTLVEMTEAAIEVLERRPEGFFLMVEAASIDKMEHPLDGPRVAYDTIEFDQAIAAAKAWASRRRDTLIVVTADHNHSMSIVGTNDRRDNPTPDREGNGVYADAGYPTYVDSNGDGFPDDPNPEVQFFFGWSNHPDHTDDFQHNAVFQQPALRDATGRAVDNPDRDPGALLQIGNLPYNQTNCVHTVEDVSVFASGPGASRFNAFLDNTEIFFAIMDALGLKAPVTDGESTEKTTPVVVREGTPEPATIG